MILPQHGFSHDLSPFANGHPISLKLFQKTYLDHAIALVITFEIVSTIDMRRELSIATLF